MTPPSPRRPSALHLTTALALVGLALLPLGSPRAEHPTGDIDTAAARRAGIDPAVTEVGCLDCHTAHGAGPEQMLTAGSATSGCLSCHTGLGRNLKASHPWGVRLDGASARAVQARGRVVGAQDTMTCLSCHAAHEDVSAQESCASCHRDQGRALTAVRGEGHSGVACLECHAVHPGVGDTARRATRTSAGDPEGCNACHAPGRTAAKAGLSPGKLGHPVAGIQHEGKAVACETCHDSHAPQVQGDGCADCHTEQQAAKARGGHGDTTCQTCHPTHAASPMEGGAAAALDVNPVSKACLSCHGEKVGRGEASRVIEYEHPTPVFDLQGKRWTPLAGLTLYSAAGEPLPTGQNGDLTCSTCHVTHGPESDKNRDNLRRGGWEDACAACHGDDALPLYRYFHQPERRADIRTPTGG